MSNGDCREAGPGANFFRVEGEVTSLSEKRGKTCCVQDFLGDDTTCINLQCNEVGLGLFSAAVAPLRSVSEYIFSLFRYVINKTQFR